MRLFFTLFLATGLSLTAGAQQNYNSGWGWNTTKLEGNGDVVTQDRSVRDFRGVEVCCALRVELTAGSQYGVRVEAESNIIDYVRTEVSGDRLEIGFKEKVSLRSTADIVIYVTMPTIDYVAASSSSKVVGKSSFKGEDLDVDVSSSGKVELDFTGDYVRVDASSSGRCTLVGTGSRIKANASSGSSIRASDFRTRRGDAAASSGAGIVLYVTEELEADASSGGSVKYRGNPGDVDSDRSSGGSVRSID